MAELLAFSRPRSLGQCIEGPAWPGRASAAAQADVTLREGLRPGGRWDRILTALAEAGHPLTIAALARLTASGRRSMKEERRKIHRALRAMADLGLVADRPPAWALAPCGVLAAAALERGREVGR